jgi:putative membrane protein
MTANLVTGLAATVIFAAVGIATFIVAFWLIDRLTPYSLWKEIIDEHNTALALLVGLIAVGVSIIIAASIL